MKDEYFDSDEFKAILEKYETSRQQGTTCYLDVEDFIDIADSYLLNEQPEDALAAVNAGLELHPNEVDLLSTKSGVYIFQHNYEDASRIIRRLPQRDGNVLYQRAQLAYAIDNDIDVAEDLFYDWLDAQEKESKFDTDEEKGERIRDAYIHIVSSFIELRGSHYDEELVKRWVEAYYARFAPLGGSDIDLMLADMVRSENMTDMVEKFYSSILQHDPYINYGWVVLSAAQVINGHYEEALESADFALAIDPGNADAILNKAHAYYSLDMRDKALTLFEEFLTKIDDANQYLPYALCLLTDNQIEKGKRYLKKAEAFVSLNKDLTDYYCEANFEMAQAYLALRNPKKAKSCILHSLELMPENLDYLLFMGTVEIDLQQIPTGVQYFSKCVRYADDKVEAICAISLRFISRGYYDIALEVLKTMDKSGPGDPSYRIVSAYKAFVYLLNKDEENFLAFLERACEECPDILQQLLSDKFPENVNPKDYYEYVLNNPLE